MYNPRIIKNPAKVKEPKPYSFPTGFAGGMNTAYTADQIQENQSPDMLNMNFDDGGVPTKRTGYSAVNTIGTAGGVKGEYFYYRKGVTDPIHLVAHSTKLYSCHLTTGALTSLYNSMSGDQVNFFTFNDTCFWYDQSSYGYVDSTGAVDVIDGHSDNSYAPTVTLGRSPDGTTSTVYEAYNSLSYSAIDSFSGTVGDTVFQLSATGFAAAEDIGPVYANGVLLATPADYSVNIVTGEVTTTASPGLGTNNLTVEWYHETFCKTQGSDVDLIGKCTIHAVYGGKNDTRVFMAGNPTYPNYQWISGVTEAGPDPTYFPVDGSIAIDSDAEAITGMARMADYLIIYKDRSQYYQTIDDSASPTTFPVMPLNAEYGCIAPRSVVEVSNG
ncbi:MAG: hypothetical protein WC364_10965, partial [Eubacteriales bacterium]